MRTRIVPIGNSQGVRIPKLLLEQTGLSDEVEIIAKDGTLVIQSARQPRAGWAAAFQEMAHRGDAALPGSHPRNHAAEKPERSRSSLASGSTMAQVVCGVPDPYHEQCSTDDRP